MKSFAALLLAPLLVAAVAPPAPPAGPKPPPPAVLPTPLQYGVLLFPGFQSLDVFGPLDVLNTLSFTQKNISLATIARTLDPVSTISKTSNGTFGEKVVVTHTFDNPPAGLEVLLVPGGAGTRSTDLEPEINFIRKAFPKVRYVIAVCTGNALIARAGLLDGKKATGNKKSWAWLTTQSDKVHWIAQARWVVSSPKIWSTSGVSAGVDGTLNWVSTVYGEAVATDLAHGLEWRRVTDPSDDEFAGIWGAKDVLPAVGPKPPKNE
jgi:transcriptional regulator GlxA family with amidase domain